MKITDLLGTLAQSGMTESSSTRLKNSLGGGFLDSLAGILQGGGGAGTEDSPPSSEEGGLLGGLTDLLGGGSSGASRTAALSSEGEGPAGGLLGNVLEQAGRMVGGKQNLALGGLGALIGGLVGPRKGLGGAVGGGLMALLGVMAFQALKGKTAKKQAVPLGLRAPQNDIEKAELERHMELVLRAMINAAKADGQIDQDELTRIVGKIKEVGADDESQRYLLDELRKPMETEQLVVEAKGHPELAAELYAASLLAIEVDTPAEKTYLDRLAADLGLKPKVTRNLMQVVGMPPA
jgi:uncharacterized membrane protein YebE (DUF533 family)